MEPDFAVPLVRHKNLHEKALEQSRAWFAGKELPRSAEDLPADCPVWAHGLSLGQASMVLSVLRAERMEELLDGGSLFHQPVRPAADDPPGLPGLGAQGKA